MGLNNVYIQFPLDLIIYKQCLRLRCLICLYPLIQGHNLFITLAFAIRIIEAVGNAAFLTASFAIIAKEFPDNIGTTFVSSIHFSTVQVICIYNYMVTLRPPSKPSSGSASSLVPWWVVHSMRSAATSCRSPCSVRVCSSRPC